MSPETPPLLSLDHAPFLPTKASSQEQRALIQNSFPLYTSTAPNSCPASAPSSCSRSFFCLPSPFCRVVDCGPPLLYLLLSFPGRSFYSATLPPPPPPFRMHDLMQLFSSGGASFFPFSVLWTFGPWPLFRTFFRT